MRELSQCFLENGSLRQRETRRQRHIRAETLIQNQTLKTGDQQTHPLEVAVRHRKHHNLCRQLLGARRHHQHGAYRVTISPHQPASSELGATKVARHHYHGIPQTAAL
ncbi:MAG: hypothetical protein BWY63_02904 [Chloroflexi bacterium ADurb.Bin360]|nr:MAG: hypothetical protein BWY63_02904 [Chloroflexi bacterium ADurb.Bin360]